jgi:hypothetical protein
MGRVVPVGTGSRWRELEQQTSGDEHDRREAAGHDQREEQPDGEGRNQQRKALARWLLFPLILCRPIPPALALLRWQNFRAARLCRLPKRRQACLRAAQSRQGAAPALESVYPHRLGETRRPAIRHA